MLHNYHIPKKLIIFVSVDSGFTYWRKIKRRRDFVDCRQEGNLALWMSHFQGNCMAKRWPSLHRICRRCTGGKRLEWNRGGAKLYAQKERIEQSF